MSHTLENISASPSRAVFTARLSAVLIAGLAIGAAVAAVSPGPFLSGWLAAGLLATLCLLGLLLAWQWGGAGRALAGLMLLAFLLRLVTGIGLSLALPVAGNAEKAQQAGYLFKDAYFRDNEAWELSQSGKPLWASFRDEFATDQYGGLLALSALIYRVLSPDAHRPFLILILGAFFAALGVPFLRAAIRLRWAERVAVIATWVYVLYPDAIFFGSSQMREPFLVGLSALAFWAVLAWQMRRPVTWLALVGSLLGMALISSRVAAAVAGFLGLLFLLEYVVSRPSPRWRAVGWVAVGLGLVVILIFTWDWFRSSSAWDLLVTERSSGQMGTRIEEVGEDLRVALIAVYGLTRPVLPAAIAETSIPLWKTIAIIRSLGWYALAPFLLYGMLTIWRESDQVKRRRLVWLALVVAIWLVVASLRGGGDATDNPRYRSLFIPWLALLAAWSVDWALAHKDAWLWRWIGVEGIFISFFTHWYLSRYYRIWAKLPFWEMVLWILLLSGLVLAGGWAWDRLRAGKVV